MSSSDAYVVAREFAPEPARVFQVPFHYLLYAERGALTLEAEGKRWTLPPARAALIAAGEPVCIALPQRVWACSALFAPGFAPTPPSTLAVFEMTPLARELLAALRGIGEDDPLDQHAETLARALVATAWRLSERPTPAVMPVPRNPRLSRALAVTRARLDQPLTLPLLAAEVATTPRSLARLFAREMGMTWSETRRKLRMIAAIEMMAEGDQSVTEIALSVGYSSMSAFNAAFRGFAGCAPTEFRAGMRA